MHKFERADYRVVDRSNPINDQLHAQILNDLAMQLAITDHIMKQAAAQDAGEAAVLAAYASSLIEGEDVMPRKRMGSMLALALIRLRHCVEFHEDGDEEPEEGEDMDPPPSVIVQM